MEQQEYGKIPVGKWIVIYLAIAVVFFGLIYYFMVAKTATPVTPPSGLSEMTVKLNEQNSSGESGEATLKEDNGKTTVVLKLTGFAKDIPQPAHIHAGSCPGVEAVKYPLANVINGSSVTILNATLAEIKQNLPLAVNVHKSAQEITNYTACGELPSN